MNYISSAEQKRYRNSFIMLTLVSVFGILLGLYLYEYTGFFSTLKNNGISKIATDFNIEELISLYYDEIKLPLLMFALGFTLFARYACTALVCYKGFMTGFSVMYFGIHFEGGELDIKNFRMICLSLIVILLINIIAGAKSMAFAASLRYAAPNLSDILRQRSTGKYIMASLILAFFLLCSVALKYLTP